MARATRSAKPKAVTPPPAPKSEELFPSEQDVPSEADLFENTFFPESHYDSESASDFANSRKKAKNKKGKKRRTKACRLNITPKRAPTIPGMSDDEYLAGSRDDSPVLGEDPASRHARRAAVSQPIVATDHISIPNVLQLHLHTASNGAVININLAEILAKDTSTHPRTALAISNAYATTVETGLAEDDTTLLDDLQPASKRRKIARPSTGRARIVRSRTGFLDLPYEIKVRIYRQTFVTETPIDLASREDLSRSASFLRTCSEVHDEGRAILYGENAFHFERSPTTRGQLWEKQWKEIGFKDIRRFLETIGHVNISHVKYVSFLLFDAAPGITPYLDEIERRFANDPVLHCVFDLIGRNAVLSKLAFTLGGRRAITAADYMFLKYFTTMKCNELIHAHSIGYHHSKIHEYLVTNMKKVMVVAREAGDAVDLKKKKKPTVKMFHEKPRPSNYYGSGW